MGLFRVVGLGFSVLGFRVTYSQSFSPLRLYGLVESGESHGKEAENDMETDIIWRIIWLDISQIVDGP